MHINFKRLTLHNFMSFGDTTVEFNDLGFVRVTGVNENPSDMAGSNGSGKSSLWEAIIWCLTGDTMRGTKQIVNINGTDGTFVELVFYLDSCEYRLIRSKEHSVYKTNLQIFIDGKDSSGKGIRDSEKLLSTYIPDITASLLGSVIILGQGLPDKFTNNTPSGRKEVLEKLSKSDFMIEDLKRRVLDRKNELTKDIRVFEDDTLSKQSQVKLLEKQIDSDREYLATLDKAQLEEDLKTRIEFKQTLLSNIAEHESSIVTFTEVITETTNEVVKINDQLNKALSTLDDGYSFAIDGANEDITKNKVQKRSLEQEIHTKESIRDVCPTCGQRLPDVVKPDTSYLHEQLKDTQLKLQTAVEELAKLEREKERKAQDLRSSFSTHRVRLEQDLATTKEQLSYHQSRVKILRNALTTQELSINELNTKISKIDYSVSTLNERIIQNQAEIQVATDGILYNNKQKELQQSRLEVINKFDTALKRDFRGYLLSTVIDYIEAQAKHYSEVIFDNSKIKFNLDGNNIDIRYLDKAYENLSGGEKQKIDLIIQFAIRDMLSTHLGFTSNILVLDEVFDGLDMLGCQKVIDMISALSDVKNVFIVTHRKDLSIPTDRELIVVKSKEGISEIR